MEPAWSGRRVGSVGGDLWKWTTREQLSLTLRRTIKLRLEGSPVKLAWHLVALWPSSGNVFIRLEGAKDEGLMCRPHLNARGQVTDLLLDQNGKYWKVL